MNRLASVKESGWKVQASIASFHTVFTSGEINLSVEEIIRLNFFLNRIYRQIAFKSIEIFIKNIFKTAYKLRFRIMNLSIA